MKIKSAVLLMAMVFLAGCASYEARQIKICRDGLEPMIGRGEPEVLDLITQTWKYGLLDHWEAGNPAVETVLRNNFRSHGFSRREAETLFAPPGAYRVMIFTKPLSREELMTGSIDSLGGGVIGSNERNVSATNGFIRIVFRDGRLVGYWAGM